MGLEYRTLQLPAAAVLVAGLALSGCNSERQETREEIMQKKQAAAEITYSVERDNINSRLKLGNDPNQIQWFYGFSGMGDVIFKSVVRGKVSSSGKRLEPKTTEGRIGGGGGLFYNRFESSGHAYATNELMGTDGTYGSSDKYVFWFTPEGQYHQWNGPYVVSSVPIRLKDPVLNFSDVDRDEYERGMAAARALKAGHKVGDNLEVRVLK